MTCASGRRKTLAETAEQLREPQAARAFEAAVRVSRMRHAAVRAGRPKVARALSLVKHRLLRLAARLSPRVTVRPATDDPVRLLWVRYRGRALHVLRAWWEAA